MQNGVVVISPQEAIRKAGEMKTLAGQIEELLNTVSKRISEVDNVDTGMYQGRKKPAELRAELDSFRDVFNLAYEQIIKSADDIVTLANVSENQ
jgi:hypothetical protein